MHFGSLAAERAQSGRTVYAIEHGLTEKEIADLESAIRARDRDPFLSDNDWLAWVVYATEIGYQYSGEEFWETFGTSTPNWEAYGSRNWIRTQFKKFQRLFSGATPKGIWAQHFSIICWPITHAILPKDLQEDLAEVLYQIRRGFRVDLFERPELLGREIAAHSFGFNSRFQNLTQDHVLVGQISTALMHPDELGEALVHPATLKRIAGDLERMGSAGTWLKGARHAAQRINVKGLRPVGSDGSAQAPGRDRWSQQTPLTLPVEIWLRRSDEASWHVMMTLPNLTDLVVRYPDLRDPLMESRCIVGSDDQRPLARGRLLYDSTTIPLNRWPVSANRLVTFESASAENLNEIVNATYTFPAGPMWVFHIRDDGVAVEVPGKAVHPGGAYILVSLERFQEEPENSQVIECAGVHGLRVELPGVVPAHLAEILERLGLNVVRTVRVRPVGLPVPMWDGEGQGQWLVDDPIMLSIEADHSISHLRISDQDLGSTLELHNLEPGEARFVDLSDLDVGRHRFKFEFDTADIVLPPRELEVVVRQVRVTSAVNETSPLMLVIDPLVPTLEQLWSGEVSISVFGPTNRALRCHVSLESRDGEVLFEAARPLPLPIDSAHWRRFFEESAKQRENASDVFELAASCRLTWDGGELGQLSISCRRTFFPLRWLLRKQGNEGAYGLQLMDDADESSSIAVERYAFEQPDRVMEASPADYRASRFVAAQAGLYVATSSGHSASTIVPPMIRSLKELGAAQARIQLAEVTKTRQAIAQLVELYEIWSRPTSAGNVFGEMRRAQVQRVFRGKVLSLICGPRWEKAERALENGPSNLSAFRDAFDIGRNELRVYEQLLSAHRGLRFASFARVVAEIEAVTRAAAFVRVGPRMDRSPESAKPTWRAEFALRLSIEPDRVGIWARNDFDYGIQAMIDHPILLRGARFLVLALSVLHGGMPHMSLEEPNQWEWR